MGQFETFVKLHHAEIPVLIGNIWDAGSARLLAENGFKAIATSSAAVALSMGYEDGENLPFALLLETVTRIKRNISLPLSVDMERGYSDSIPGIINNIEKLHDIGVAGINIEDSSPITGQLQPVEIFAKTLSAIADHLSKKKMRIFINARTDAFLWQRADALTETNNRIKMYEAAGASGIFVPFIKDENDIRAVVKATRLPLNVLSVPQLPDIEKLSSLGVKRVSLGSSLYRSVNKEILNKIEAIQAQGSFRFLF